MLKILVEGIIFFSRRVFVLFSKFFLLNVRWKQKDVCKTRKAQRHWSGIALQSRLQIVIPCTVSCELVPARPHPQRGGPVSTSCLISCFSFCHQLLPGFRFRSVPYTELKCLCFALYACDHPHAPGVYLLHRALVHLFPRL